jgi:hypothetical protein
VKANLFLHSYNKRKRTKGLASARHPWFRIAKQGVHANELATADRQGMSEPSRFHVAQAKAFDRHGRSAESLKNVFH